MSVLTTGYTIRLPPVLILSPFIFSVPPVLPLTIHHRRQRTHKRGHNRRRNNPRRVHTAILATISDHIDRYQLQGRNIQNQKRAHLIAGNPAALSICHHKRLTAALTCLVPLFPFVCENAFPCRRITRCPSLLLQLRQLLHCFHPPSVKLMTRTYAITLKI